MKNQIPLFCIKCSFIVSVMQCKILMFKNRYSEWRTEYRRCNFKCNIYNVKRKKDKLKTISTEIGLFLYP